MNTENDNETSGSKFILIFGAGKSATCLIDYMIQEAAMHHWNVTVADNDLELAKIKTGSHPHARAVAVNVENSTQRNQLVASADIVISLLPPALHFLVAQDCVLLGKNLLTASYTDDKIKSLQQSIEKKGLLFICEMGLDPGIDHMSAMQLLHSIKEKGGVVTSFVSHCGGLVAPESDDNPWHYKISWNPRNVVMAGKSGAVYLRDNIITTTSYENLFDEKRTTAFPGLNTLAWYPNRDSLSYKDLYQLHDAATFIRTTLRYPSYCYGWKKIIDLKLTAEDIFYETTDMSWSAFFRLHFKIQGFSDSIAELQKQPDPFLTQLEYLGFNDDTLINKGRCSAMDILQFALEKKLVLAPSDKDMILMLHEIDYELQGKKYIIKSSLVVKGDDNTRTAMAKTVGLPLGIAAKLILLGAIKETGLRIPVIPTIYQPVLKELEKHSIIFSESVTTLN